MNKVGLHPHTIHKKINSKWITDLNVRAKTIKSLEENIEKPIFSDFGLGKVFLDIILKSQATTTKK